MNLVLILIYALFPLQDQILEGVIVDAVGQKPVPFANISIIGTEYGAISDSLGKFSLDITNHEISDTFAIRVTSVGYFPAMIKLDSRDLGDLRIELKPATYILEDVYVESQIEDSQKEAEKLVKSAIKNLQDKVPAHNAQATFRKVTSQDGRIKAYQESRCLLSEDKPYGKSLRKEKSPDEWRSVTDTRESVYCATDYERLFNAFVDLDFTDKNIMKYKLPEDDYYFFIEDTLDSHYVIVSAYGREKDRSREIVESKYDIKFTIDISKAEPVLLKAEIDESFVYSNAAGKLIKTGNFTISLSEQGIYLVPQKMVYKVSQQIDRGTSVSPILQINRSLSYNEVDFEGKSSFENSLPPFDEKSYPKNLLAELNYDIPLEKQFLLSKDQKNQHTGKVHFDYVSKRLKSTRNVADYIVFWNDPRELYSSENSDSLKEWLARGNRVTFIYTGESFETFVSMPGATPVYMNFDNFFLGKVYSQKLRDELGLDTNINSLIVSETGEILTGEKARNSLK